VEGVELPKPYDLQYDDAGRPVVLYTADQLRTAVAAALGRGAVPQGYVLAPEWRGYALLGSGQYLINHSADFDPDLGAELIITLATDEDREGDRQIGESRPTKNPGESIQADDMVIRIGFLSERGLFALEDQLSEIRKLHFAAAPSPEALQPTQAEAPSEREAFEAAYRRLFGKRWVVPQHQNMFQRNGDVYEELSVNDLWQMWQARAALATQQAVQEEPVAAQHRFRHPQKGTPDWSEWQPCKVSNRPAREIDSQGYEVEYRALGVIATHPAPGQVEPSLETDGPQFDDFFRCRIDSLADKHPTLIVRQLARRLREAWKAPGQVERDREDSELLDWLTEQLVDTIYLDDGRIIDVGTGRIGLKNHAVSPHDVRSAIRAARSSEGGGNEHSR
jgi:hypothetical protein